MLNEFRLNYKHLRFFIKFICITAGVFIMNTCSAQHNKQSIALTSSGKLTVASNVTMSESFEFDISNLHFSTELQAVEYFASKRFDGIMIRPHFDRQVAYLYLDKKKFPNRTWEEWKQAISSESSKSPIKN
jgi:hypothetical protein